MKQLKKNQLPAELPGAVVLTPDQLMAVAGGTAATIAKLVLGGGEIVISGALPTPPILMGPFTQAAR